MLSIPQAQRLVKQYFGEDLKPCQAEIFSAVFDMTKPRVAILGATQIQKSRATAKAIGLLATLGIGITIVGPKEEQALTPLQYFISEMGKNKYFQNLMLQGGEEKIERLQSQESKSSVSFVGGGHIRSLTLNERDDVEKRRSTLGKGDQIIVFEEASLTSNITEAMVMRMIAGWGYSGRIIKLGNAITKEKDNDHYFRATQGEENYYVIKVDYHRALQEGIYTPEFIEQVRSRFGFDSLYGCIFPEPSELVKGGYRRLFTVEKIIEATVQEQPELGNEPPIAGIDIGQGLPDTTVIVMRWPNYAKKVFESRNPDVMAQIGEYQDILREFNPKVINVDGTGMGNGIAPRLQELGFPAYSVIVGASIESDYYAKQQAEQATQNAVGFANLKAWGYNEALAWLTVMNGKLGSGNWNELTEVAGKVRSDKHLIIESKEELRDRGIASYNDAEAFMLTFMNQNAFNIADDLFFA